MKRIIRVGAAIAGGLLGLLLLACIVVAIDNRGLLAKYRVDQGDTTPPDRLTTLDKARLAEALQLKAAAGDQVWPGWGRADLPVILWTGGAEFLTGMPGSPDEAGWQTVEGDNLAGKAYFRRLSSDPQNFAMRVGERWLASMATKEETDRFLISQFHSVLPGLFKAIFPYRALILPSEVQMTGVLHETFHAYQATVTPARLEAAEQAHKLGSRYWAADMAMRDAWKQEMDLLIRALQAKSNGEARALAGQFLVHRAQRREASKLPSDLIDYERQLEWEEGSAKYVELAIWQNASQSANYLPLPELSADPQFKAYRTFERRFNDELGTMRRSSQQEGETRLYYTGMAEAMLLDRLAPGWQAHAFEPGVWLEDLLAKSL